MTHAARLTSPVADRLNQLADAQDVLADVCADAAEYANGSADASYGLGQSDAYRAAALQLRHLATQENDR